MQKYIDLKWHTVPLSGQLQRLDDGIKTIPQFEKDWRNTYQEKFNERVTKIGGVITGECSNIMAIDCDNDDTWALFKALDPTYEFVFISKGKGKVAGTLIYEFDKELAESFSINDGTMALDFYANRGFVYLPTRSNRTKEYLDGPLPEVKPIPPAAKLILLQLNKRLAPPVAEVPDNQNIMTAACLAPIIEQFNKDGKFMPGLFRIITPKSFRQEANYVAKGYLHPDDVPQGRGSEYLSKVSAILGADLSVTKEDYAAAMNYINELFTAPMSDAKLDKTIIDPMLTEKASINGKPIWAYDADWKKFKLILHSKRQIALELCFDDNRNTYYVVDELNQSVKNFHRDSELMSFIEAATMNAPKKIEVKRALPLAEVRAVPNLPFGFNPGTDPTVRLLNTFIQTPELGIFTNPDAYAEKYSKPVTILKYFEALVPEEKMRNYLLQFVHTKLQTFGYSPVVLYFMGAHGSGKDIFVGLLETIMGHVARPSTKEFLEMFNGWIVDQYFVQLDEYGNQLSSNREREEALGKIKAYTGKQNIQVRQMRTDGFMYKHNATFIMTANKNPLMVEEGDRRICFLQTPNVLAEQDWVIEMGGVAAAYNRIQDELKDFCYYLAKEVKPLSPSAYMKPPEADKKQELIADSMYAAQRIGFVVKNNMTEYLLELFEDHSLPAGAKALRQGHLLRSHLEDLYDEMTEQQGNTRSFLKALRAAGVRIEPTTKNGEKQYNVHIKTPASPFEEED
jgi:hypothetical protein